MLRPVALLLTVGCLLTACGWFSSSEPKPFRWWLPASGAASAETDRQSQEDEAVCQDAARRWIEGQSPTWQPWPQRPLIAPCMAERGWKLVPAPEREK